MEIKPFTCGQLIYKKEGRLYNRKKTTSISGAEKNWMATCKTMKLEHSLILHTKINSKCNKQLNVRSVTTQFLEENIGRTPSDINHSNKFLDPSPQIMKIKTKINK